MTVTRFAPSPTGLLHVGNIRTAVFNWAIARAADGTFILRLDDTDPERSKQEYADAIRRDLEWLGLTWDREEKQSERLDFYAEAANKLRDGDRLYPAYETPQELGLKRKAQLATSRPPVYDRAARNLTDDDRTRLEGEGRRPHWRFLLDRQRIEWADLVLGDQSIDAASVSDPVLIREDGQVLYTIASVVDDTDMEITHVVRGADHVTNTATQIQIFEALGGKAPEFAHHSLLTGPGGEGLSKRLGSLSISQLRENGVEPLAVVAMLARLGSSDPIEVRSSVQDVVEDFDITRFGAAPTRFDPDELKLLSTKTLHGLSFDDVKNRLQLTDISKDIPGALWGVVGGNLEKWSEFNDWVRIVDGDVSERVEPEDAEFVAEALAALPPRPWDETTWKSWTSDLKAKSGRKGKSLFLPLRRALTGRDHGPEMAKLMPLLKKP